MSKTEKHEYAERREGQPKCIRPYTLRPGHEKLRRLD
jgi:hypothetical protein